MFNILTGVLILSCIMIFVLCISVIWIRKGIKFKKNEKIVRGICGIILLILSIYFIYKFTLIFIHAPGSEFS